MAKRPGREPRGVFLCECGASLCDRRVSLSGSEYDELAAPLLARGHEPDGELGAEGRRTRDRRRRR